MASSWPTTNTTLGPSEAQKRRSGGIPGPGTPYSTPENQFYHGWEDKWIPYGSGGESPWSLLDPDSLSKDEKSELEKFLDELDKAKESTPPHAKRRPITAFNIGSLVGEDPTLPIY